MDLVALAFIIGLVVGIAVSALAVHYDREQAKRRGTAELNKSLKRIWG